ncbi:phage tail fiber protein [Enterobacter hormaechei]|uniref:phage tail fiber domain-containing protein n=1 Tax=Enterobacter cloacae complex TaxID=354276 RepID=UPI000F848864|nr:phage tail fiber protein [Enterobacter hormaechei]RTN64903.1 hypothetical protein EKN88_21155 [Enterobacter hormaechei]
MSVPNQTPYIIYNANGLTTVFPFEFYIINAGDIQVSINGTVVTSGYSVSGVGNVGGGDVVFVTPPASGAVVMLERVVPTYRLTDYQDNGDLLADTVNKDFDRLWMAIQRAFIYLGLALRRPLFGGPFNAEGYRIANLGDPINAQDAATRNYVDNVSLVRTLRVPESSVSILPPADQRANKLLAFNAAGQPIVVLPASGSASDVMIELAKPDGEKYIGECPDIATLRTIEPSFDKQRITVREHTVGLGKTGGGVFWYDATDTTSTDNNGHYIVTTAGARWKRKEVDVKPEHFGYNTTYTGDQTSLLQAAIYFAVEKNRKFIGSTRNTIYITSTIYIPPFLTADWRGMKIKTVTNSITAVRLSSGSATIPAPPYKPGTPLDQLEIEGRYKTGTAAVPDETFTTNGLVIGESASSQTSDLNIVNLIVRGFQSCITVTGPNSYLLKFDNLHCGVAWFRGFAWTASSNSGENIQFFGGSIYNCINTAGTAQGLYIAPTASSVELTFNGTSFDYNDVDVSQNLGNITLNDCHMENNNNNPKITIANTASKEPSKLKIKGGSMGGGPGASSLNPTVESATGRPCYIDVTSAGTSVVINGLQVGSFYTIGNVTQVVRNSSSLTMRKLEIGILQNAGPATTEGWPLNPSFFQNLLTSLGFGSISGWTLNSANGVTLTAVTSVSASHDSGARQLERSSSGTATGMSFYQDVRVRSGKTMIVKAWLQTLAIIANGGTATIQTTFLNEDKSVTVQSAALAQRAVSADGTLTECATVIPVPAGAAWMRVAIYGTNIPTGTTSRIYSSGERVWEI